MSVIEIPEYNPHDFLKVKKEFILKNYLGSPTGQHYIRFLRQKLVIIIDLTPSTYSYHFGIQDIIYNKILPTLRVLVKSLYRQHVSTEVSVICTRMNQIPLHVIVHSYKIEPNGNYKDLISCIKGELNELHSNFNAVKDEAQNIKFNTVLKWSLFALEMMDKNRLPMVVLITNTVNSFVSSAIYDGLVMQYCANEVSFNVISLCSHKGFRFGLNSDYLALKEASKATGGNFIKASELESKVKKIFIRKIFKQRVNTASDLDLCYKLGVKLEDLLLCRLREGFCLWDLNESIVLGLRCGNSVNVEYHIRPAHNFCDIKVFIVGPNSLVGKIKERLKIKTVNIKDEEPSFHERISWILYNISETENFAYYLTQILQGKTSFSKLLTMNLNIWHRWMDVERLDIIIGKSNNDYNLAQGRKKLNEGIKSVFKQYENENFIEVGSGSLILGKVLWEGVNKAVLFIGKYGENSENKVEELYLELKKISGIDVFNKPLGRMIVESISTNMNYYSSPVQSAHTYKPHIEALKAYLLKKSFKYKLLNSSWNPYLIQLLYESTIKKGFHFIGNCPNGKQLLLKTHKLKDQNQPIFFQYLLYMNQTDVIVEFFIDPQVINKDEMWSDLLRTIEISDVSLYKSVYTLNYIIFKSLRKKLKDDDFIVDETISNNKMFHLAVSDDLFCFIDSNSNFTYAQQKKLIRKEMLKVLSKYESVYFDSPNIMTLLNHSVVITRNMENFAEGIEDENAQSVRLKFFENLISAFIEISDFYREEFKIHFFVRYLTDESIVVWKLPRFEEFLQKKSSNIGIEFFECNLKRINPVNSAPVHMPKGDLTQVLVKTIDLVQKMYSSVYNTTFFQLFTQVQHCKQCLSTVIKNCYTDKRLVDCSSLSQLITKPYKDVPTLVCSVLHKLNTILSKSFKRMDKEFISELDKQFEKVGKTNLYIFKDKSAGVFLKFGKYSDKISHCINDSKIKFEIFTFPKNQFFRKELQSIKSCKSKEENLEILEFVCKKVTALVAQQALELLLESFFVDQGVIDKVKEHLKLIPETVEFSYKLDLITPKVDFAEFIQLELLKNEVFYCKCVGNCYFLVSKETDKNFMMQKDFDKEVSQWDWTETEKYWIDFWVLISIESINTIKVMFYLPKYLEFKNLNTMIVKNRLIKQIQKLEVRVNQRILLKNLMETGKISSMLLPAETKQPEPEEKPIKTSSRWVPIKKDTHSKLTPSSSSFYRLPLHLSHYFPITDHLTKSDALNCLSAKYSIPPFSIDNIENIFMLVHKQDIWLFKFIETTIQVTTIFPHISKKSAKDTGTISVRFIKLQVYGIDAPDIDTFNKLKQNIEELLQQISMTRLADLLTKNQKKIMTVNDYQFIIGSSIPILIMYQIPMIVNNFDLFTAMIKQNLLRFLNPFSIQDSVVLVYNFLKIIDTNTSKNNRTLLSKHTGSVNYLGNTFGKALALISFELFYYDGENISEFKQPGFLDFPKNPSVIKEEFISLKKFSGLSAPRAPGYYLEVKISPRGSLNIEAFTKQLDSCIRQSIFEYILEKIQDEGVSLNFTDRYYLNMDCTRVALMSSFKNKALEIPHYSNWQNIFLLYDQILGIIEEQLDNKVRFCYGFCTDTVKCCSKNINEIKEQWNIIADEVHIGTFVAFSAILDHELIKESDIQDFKFYPSETIGSVQIKRSIYISIQITNKTVQIGTYNLNKNFLFKIQNAVELHILWTRERYLKLNSNLMQKLGLFCHNIDLHPGNSNNQAENVKSALPNAICLLEVKENQKQFPLESLFNPYETMHTEDNGEENPKDVKLKGSYPLIRYGLNKFCDVDHVKRHGMHMSAFLDRKIDHINQYEYCALACVRWTKMKNTPLDKMIMKISKNAKIRDEVHLVKGIIGSSHLFFKVNTKFYMKPVDKFQKIQYTICDVLKQYTEKIMKIGKFEAPMQSEPKSFRKKSYEDTENPLKFVQSYYSSGALLSENRTDVMQSYLKKVIDKSLIIIEISYENSVIVTNGYCIENFYKCFPMYRFEDLEYNGLVTKEMNKLKINIDPISILYDIYIRSICNLLDSHREKKEIDYIRTITEICSELKKPPRKSCNSVTVFNIFYNLGESSHWTPDEFFMFFLMNCREKGYSYSPISKKSPFVYKKIFEIPDEAISNHQSTQKWLIFTKNSSLPPQSQKELSINCFILKCDENRKLKNDALKTMKHSIEKDFVGMMDEFKELYRRDQLWNKIREQNNNFSFEDFELLLKASKVSSMHDIDNRIKYLTSFKNVFTINCIRYLAEAYNKNSKVFDMGKQVFLLIIYSQKILAQLVLNREEQSLQIFSVMRSIGCSQKEEDDLVTDLINKIIQWLWVRFTTNEKL